MITLPASLRPLVPLGLLVRCAAWRLLATIFPRVEWLDRRDARATGDLVVHVVRGTGR